MRIYDAEAEVFGAKRWGDVSLLHARSLIHSYDPTIKVERKRAGTRGFNSSYFPKDHLIRLGPQAGLCVVLHELAHALAAEATTHVHTYSFNDQPFQFSTTTPRKAGHGTKFLVKYLELIEAEMGQHWARRLRAAIERHQPKGWKATVQ